jgi:hypothetical protein
MVSIVELLIHAFADDVQLLILRLKQTVRPHISQLGNVDLQCQCGRDVAIINWCNSVVEMWQSLIGAIIKEVELNTDLY